MIDNGKIPNRGGVFIDAYNQSINENIAGTITTRVDASNMVFVTEICDTKEKRLSPTKVSTGTTTLPSFEGHWGGGISRSVKTGDSLAIMTTEFTKWETIIGNKQQNPFRGSVDDCSPCITAACGLGGGMTPMITNATIDMTKTTEFKEQLRGHAETRFRIRKLTPRECFRLMSVSEENIDKIQAAGISNTQQYKMAGNSIDVNTLSKILEQLFRFNQV